MKKLKRIAACAGMLLPICTANASVEYTVTMLNQVGGQTVRGSSATAINASGQVVGSFSTATSPSHAFLYSAGKMTDLGTLGSNGGTNSYWFSYAQGLDDAGQVIGYSSGETVVHSFSFANGEMSDVTPFATQAFANGINSAGDFVGSYLNSGQVNVGYLYSGGRFVTLLPFGAAGSDAYAINNVGQVVGDADNIAFVYSHGVFTDLGTLPAPFNNLSYARAINDRGEIVGSSGSHAFLYDSGSMVDIGTLGGSSASAFGINDEGQVVGESDTGAGQDAFIYENGIMTDLNSLIPANSGLVLQDATAINDAGQIVGDGGNSTSGASYAFLLTPIPEPEALPLLAVAGFVIRRRTHRRHRPPTCVQ